MSGDIVMDPALNRPDSARPDPFAGSIARSKNEASSNFVPMPPLMQRLVERRNAEKDVERARKEAEMSTPENRQKAAEAEAAERKRKKFNFHGARAIPRFIDEGWKQIKEDFVDEEIRVYTNSNDHRRFWGIKPAGMAMDDFWEQNDPEVSRYYDKIAETWVDALIPPPVTTVPVIWAGRGVNPDLLPTEPPLPKPTPPTKATAKPRKVNQRTRKSLASKIDAGHSGLADQTQEVTAAARVDTTPKRARGRPATKAKADVRDTIISTPKRPRGRPPTKAKPVETSLKQGKKTPAVKGNARIAKPSQKRMRPSAPSTHKMRTRGKGPAELLQL